MHDHYCDSATVFDLGFLTLREFRLRMLWIIRSAVVCTFCVNCLIADLSYCALMSAANLAALRAAEAGMLASDYLSTLSLTTPSKGPSGFSDFTCENSQSI